MSSDQGLTSDEDVPVYDVSHFHVFHAVEGVILRLELGLREDRECWVHINPFDIGVEQGVH